MLHIRFMRLICIRHVPDLSLVSCVCHFEYQLYASLVTISDLPSMYNFDIMHHSGMMCVFHWMFVIPVYIYIPSPIKYVTCVFCAHQLSMNTRTGYFV